MRKNKLVKTRLATSIKQGFLMLLREQRSP
jgi:hypothetical protein